MKGSKIVLAMSLAAAFTLTYGCGTNKRIESTEVPKKKASNEEVSVKASKVASGKYLVVAHDTLWGIAGKTDVYSDNFQWPLIFKANRDTIKDPDLIYPKQDFKILKGVSKAEVSHARDLALKTPKYVPHSKPRQTLPLDYF